MPFTAEPYRLPGLLLISGRVVPDERGFFQEGYRADEFLAFGVPPLIQDNMSRSRRGVVRGLHFQKPPRPQGKLVRCVRGRILDVAVDIRRGSPTFGKWASVELSDEANRLLWIPAGFAHGFCTLSEQADVIYKVTEYFSAAHDAGIRWDDPALAVAWPDCAAVVSGKDRRLPLLQEADSGFTWS